MGHFENLNFDCLFSLCKFLSIRSSIALFSTCKRLHSLKSKPQFWEMMVVKLADEIETPPHFLVDILQNETPKHRVISIFRRPPEFKVLLVFNPAVSRDTAVNAIAQATGSSQLGSFYSALKIGHPLFADSDPQKRKGEIYRGR